MCLRVKAPDAELRSIAVHPDHARLLRPSSLLRARRFCGSNHKTSLHSLKLDDMFPKSRSGTYSPSTTAVLQEVESIQEKTLIGADRQAWDDAVQQLTAAVSMTTGEAQVLMERAFGWKSQTFWRGSKVCEVPGPGVVSAVINHLSCKLGIKGDGLLKVVKAFPEVLACSIVTQLDPAVCKLQEDWKLEGDVLLRAVVRQPQILGYNVDCGGNCQGECNRCWARF